MGKGATAAGWVWMPSRHRAEDERRQMDVLPRHRRPRRVMRGAWTWKNHPSTSKDLFRRRIGRHSRGATDGTGTERARGFRVEFLVDGPLSVPHTIHRKSDGKSTHIRIFRSSPAVEKKLPSGDPSLLFSSDWIPSFLPIHRWSLKGRLERIERDALGRRRRFGRTKAAADCNARVRAAMGRFRDGREKVRDERRTLDERRGSKEKKRNAVPQMERKRASCGG